MDTRCHPWVSQSPEWEVEPQDEMLPSPKSRQREVGQGSSWRCPVNCSLAWPP